MSQAETITRKAKSNLAFALIDLPEEKRRHMAQFYAFCRVVDDIVDEPGMTSDERHAALDRWTDVVTGKAQNLNELESNLTALIVDLSLDLKPMLNLIDGCRRDIAPIQPQTQEELLEYTYKVAACVGLTSARILGASEAAFPYAVALGHALQLVNIIRDMSEDFHHHGRIYMPMADMEQFDYSVEDIKGKIQSPELKAMLQHEADLADAYFSEAEAIYATLTPQDKNALIPAQAMSLIYGTILDKMKDDGFNIYAKRYRVNTFHKLWLLFRARLGVS